MHTAASPAPARPAGAPGAASEVPQTAVPFRFEETDRFAALLRQLGVCLLVTTYQANKLLVVRERLGSLSILVRSFERPMGVAAGGGRIALGTRDQVWQFRDAPDVAPRVEPAGAHDACFLPRSSHVTGDIAVHELAWGGTRAAELWVVNTRFSCLCTVDGDYSFVPRWRPPFVTALAAEDRCHLNGVAMVAGRPRFVTALGETDTPRGWRGVKAGGGCVMDVPGGRVVARGLSMPHSPRWHGGGLWVLESGTGRLLLLDPAGNVTRVICGLPGFARGLTFVGHYAFVGLSKIRATSAMDGVPLAERRSDLKCGVAVVDLRRGEVCEMLEFQTAVEEIFDVQPLAGPRFPDVMGFQKETLQHTFIVPPEGQPAAPAAVPPFGSRLIG